MSSPGSAGWVNVSLPISPRSVAWPGLDPPRVLADASITDGVGVNAGRLDCSLHTGTHADAPFHVDDAGSTSDNLDPDAFIGLARVVRLPPVHRIGVAELQGAGLTGNLPARVLVATATPYDGETFPVEVPALEPEAAEWLTSRGVRLFGVDQPSIDPLRSRTMEAHKALFRGGAALLENLALAGVPPGDYELFAVPLLILGADAAPCRAMLRRLATAA